MRAKSGTDKEKKSCGMVCQGWRGQTDLSQMNLLWVQMHLRKIWNLKYMTADILSVKVKHREEDKAIVTCWVKAQRAFWSRNVDLERLAVGVGPALIHQGAVTFRMLYFKFECQHLLRLFKCFIMATVYVIPLQLSPDSKQYINIFVDIDPLSSLSVSIRTLRSVSSYTSMLEFPSYLRLDPIVSI